jgi:outer membrane protein TolC
MDLDHGSPRLLCALAPLREFSLWGAPRAKTRRRQGPDCSPWLVISGILSLFVCLGPAFGQEKVIRILPPDEKSINVPPDSSFSPAPLPPAPKQSTVSDADWDHPPVPLGLDEAIRTTLANGQVVRILTGVTAVASGATIYDPAITLPTIDQAKARFDPTFSVNNTFSRLSPPTGVLDPLDPTRALIEAFPTNNYTFDTSLSKINSLGGTAKLEALVMPSRTRGVFMPLNPQTSSSIQFSYTQPLLQGAGIRANLAPIVIARLNTERSYFQFKDNVQQSVRSVIQGYWNLVFARTDLWARQQQVNQLRKTLEYSENRFRFGIANAGEVSQATTSLRNFEAIMIGSQANVLNQEAALANVMGLPPGVHLVPYTFPTKNRLPVKWEEIVKLAEDHRPDLIELKLILDADRQMLIQAQNQARPQLNGTMLYSWNGLEGTMPNGAEISRFGGTLNQWTFGVNFSVPLGLRQSRAALRQQELTIFRDQANLDQGLHSAGQSLALQVRNLAQFYDQYLVFQKAREAAQKTLDYQLTKFHVGAAGKGQTIFLEVLQAITDWGNAVSAESQSLAQYNGELALLEQETGTILESHGIRFFEERYMSLGPLGRGGRMRDYLQSMPPTPNEPKYPQAKTPAENFFELQDPLKLLPDSSPKK